MSTLEPLEPRLLLDGSDLLSPVIADVLPLPSSGGSISQAVDRLTITTSEALQPTGVNSASSWELRVAGPDNTLDTPDDVLSVLAVNPAYAAGTTVTVDILPAAGSSPSPLQPGHYRFTARASSLADLAGNSLDGDGDGTGGDDFIREFSIAISPGTVIASSSNDTLATATALSLTEDPAGGGYFMGRGLGTIRPAISGDTWSDPDYWRFSALAGDLVTISVDTPDSDLNPYVELRNSADGTLASDHNSGPDGDALINRYAITSSGTYVVRVGKYQNSSTPGAYELRVDLVHGNQPTLESDANYANDSPSQGQIGSRCSREHQANRQGLPPVR
ncbi:MAG TPA: PPC domain-containing protein [Phycisphaerae bacterium]|nr:PPC domain-containing protein [Phycisphaerae bacterium]